MVLEESDIKCLTDLRRKRGVVKAALTRHRNFVAKFNPREDSIALLEFRQEELPQINRKFDEIQCQIELIDTENLEVSEEVREAFEIDYFGVRAEMQEVINLEKSQNMSMNNNSISTGMVHSQRARLAPIALPTFDGNLQDWESFFDCYKAMVHNDDSYPLAQKFTYLRSTLSGQALDVIKGIPITEINYNVAIKRLQQRYDNKSLVIQSHIRAILDAPQVKSVSSRELQNLHSHVTTHIAALESLSQPIEHWDAWLVTIILRKVDQITNHEWQLRRTDTSLPTYIELESFIAARCITFESTETIDTNAEKEELRFLTSARKLNQGTTRKRLITSTENEPSCGCCSGKHKLYSCNKFKDLPVGERVTVVRDLKLCFNCFSPRHGANLCKSIYSCRTCKRRHNTLLHYANPIVSERVESEQYTSSPTQNVSPAAALFSVSDQSYAFLATAIVLINDIRGNQRKCRAVLDSGSQVNFISGSLAKTLQLECKKTSLPISGIGASQVRVISCVEISIRSRLSDYSVNLVCHVLPAIVNNLSTCETPKNGWQIQDKLLPQLADPSFHSPGAVDLLIGGGGFFDVTATTVPRIPLNIKNVFLNDSQFG